MSETVGHSSERDQVEGALVAAFDFALGEGDLEMIDKLYAYAASECNLTTEVIDEIYQNAL